MQFRRRMLSLAAIGGLVASTFFVATPASADDRGKDHGPKATMIADLGESANGSTVGPDGALYVAVGAEGKIYRVNPKNGHTRVFAEGLPKALEAVGYGGVVDVAFRGHTAYALVTLVDIPPATGKNGVYKIQDRDSNKLVANISKFNGKHPATGAAAGDTPGGNPFAIQTVRGGFLVTDGNFNRLFHINKWGKIKIARQFGDVVPTGLEVTHRKVYMGQAGPEPHNAADGKVISLNHRFHNERVVASGETLIVDVEASRCGRLYALSNGDSPKGEAIEPAVPNTGAFLKVKGDDFKTVLDKLNLPVSLDFIRSSAYIVSLDGAIWRVKGFEKCGGHN
jgi:hypothetical protein